MSVSGKIILDAQVRSVRLSEQYQESAIDLEPRYLLQMAHLTVPATVWKYIEKAVTQSKANLVMLDLEDSIPRGNAELLEQARRNCIGAFDLDWGSRLRFFRPRGLDLDPGHEDIALIVEHAGHKLDGLVYPKVESSAEVESIDQTLSALETTFGLAPGRIKIEVLIESARAVEQVFQIALASRRIVGLIFGSYDYWASLGLLSRSYRFDHPLLNYARARIVGAAASVGVPAIAEMTTNYPTRDKSAEGQYAALAEFRRDALLARDFGFAGKWTGIPDQTALAAEIFRIPDDEIQTAIRQARLYIEAEQSGQGATMIHGRMADRATDRIHRRTLKVAYALGLIDQEMAAELGLI